MPRSRKPEPEDVSNSIKIGPEKLLELRAQREAWKADHNTLLDAVAEMAITSMQMAHEVLVGDYEGPSANAQRMSAAALVIKEGKELVGLILKVRGTQK